MNTCMDRRSLLLLGATTASLATLGLAGPANALVLTRSYPRRRIARLSELQPNVPLYFEYPWDHPNCRSMIVRTGKRCGGGIGADRDVVAFNLLCPHMGGLLEGQYDAEWTVAGPCPLHLSTFDLTRYGMVVSGHATEGLPQVLLETEGDDVFAVGMRGLVFGFADNQEGA